MKKIVAITGDFFYDDYDTDRTKFLRVKFEDNSFGFAPEKNVIRDLGDDYNKFLVSSGREFLA